jgi:phosphoserine phosphatase
MDTRLLLTFTGPDAPGITAALTGALAQECKGALLADIEQVVVQGQLALGFVVEFPGAEGPGNAFQALNTLRALARSLGLSLDHSISADAPRDENRTRYALTVIARSIGAGELQAVSSLLASHGANIERIHRLSERGLTCLEILVSLPLQAEANLKRALLAAGSRGQFDVALQKEDLLRRSKRLVAMDMDSTLIRIEVIDELARAYGVGDEVAAITRRAMHGEMDYDQSLRERVALLKGLDVSVLNKIAEDLPLTEGAELLMKVLKRLGYRTAVISGGFSIAAEALQKRLGIDRAWSNVLEIQDGKLTGNVVGPIVNAARKAELLEQFALSEGVPLDQVVAIGDGANDLLMLQRAGHGIAFHAKPKLREAAHTAISSGGLDAVLYLLGIPERDIEALSAN